MPLMILRSSFMMLRPTQIDSGKRRFSQGTSSAGAQAHFAQYPGLKDTRIGTPMDIPIPFLIIRHGQERQVKVAGFFSINARISFASSDQSGRYQQWLHTRP